MLQFLKDNLSEVLQDAFSVLDGRYVEDQVHEVLADIESQIEKEFEMRYLVIDGETGQIESRTLHETYEQAEKTADAFGLKSYHIGELYVPVL